MRKSYFFYICICFIFILSCNNGDDSSKKDEDDLSQAKKVLLEYIEDEKKKLTDDEKRKDLDNLIDNGAQIRVLDKTHDFGTIKKGETVFHDFKIKNIGSGNLIIASAKSTCGCTVPEWPKGEQIKPGEERNITVKYKSSTKGKSNKKVTLITNSKDSYIYVLKIKANVVN